MLPARARGDLIRRIGHRSLRRGPERRAERRRGHRGDVAQGAGAGPRGALRRVLGCEGGDRGREGRVDGAEEGGLAAPAAATCS